ncbi:MAG: hypothetical protein GKR93_12190 [Gammaproteobacteria bacterium]|nr:hypothetical protein [Gammaproteobacteria bacterium]
MKRICIATLFSLSIGMVSANELSDNIDSIVAGLNQRTAEKNIERLLKPSPEGNGLCLRGGAKTQSDTLIRIQNSKLVFSAQYTEGTNDGYKYEDDVIQKKKTHHGCQDRDTDQALALLRNRL